MFQMRSISPELSLRRTAGDDVVVRCQLLPVLVECRPGSPDTILDFGPLLLQERNRLAQVFFGSCEQHRVVGKSQLREAVMIMVAQVDSHSFFLLPAGCRLSVKSVDPC